MGECSYCAIYNYYCTVPCLAWYGWVPSWQITEVQKSKCVPPRQAPSTNLKKLLAHSYCTAVLRGILFKMGK